MRASSPPAAPDLISNRGAAPCEAAAAPALALLALINAAWTTQVIHAACVHQLADHIAEGAADVSTLSAATGCDADALARLLRAMAAIGLCEQVVVDVDVDGDGHGGTTPRCWRLTSMGQCLRIDGPGSLHHWALHAGGSMWQRQGELAEAVRTGRSWAQRRGAAHTYEQLLADTAAATVFHRAMVDLTRQAIPQIVPLLEVGGARVVVDVGGGRGELLAAVLAQHPLARGVLFDQPSALNGAHGVLGRAGVGERCRLEGGDFFAMVPAQGDLYLMKSVLHNWDDRHCISLLAVCAAAMPRDARLLVIERLMPDEAGRGARHQACARSDLNMLVSLTGRERRAVEYKQLLAGAGLAVAATRESSGDWAVIEARHADV
jgi:hypothetical protein